jgi:hypothetical protein
MLSGSPQKAIDNQFLQAVTDGNHVLVESLLACDVSRYLPSRTAINSTNG